MIAYSEAVKRYVYRAAENGTGHVLKPTSTAVTVGSWVLTRAGKLTLVGLGLLGLAWLVRRNRGPNRRPPTLSRTVRSKPTDTEGNGKNKKRKPTKTDAIKALRGMADIYPETSQIAANLTGIPPSDWEKQLYD